MKQLILAVAVVALGIGCMPSYYATYDIGMTEVERPENAKERYGEPVISTSDSASVKKYVFTDSLISVAWVLTANSISFELRNKSQHSIKIIWDEVSYVDPAGQSLKVMHAGVKYTECSNSHPPSVIVKNGFISDIITPCDYVHYSSPSQYSSGGWIEDPFFTPSSGYTLSALEPAKQNIGKIVKVLLPVEIEGTVNEYVFSFKVNAVTLPKE